MYGKSDVGCWADGSYGHSHVRAKLADMMDSFGRTRLSALLEGEMSDDGNEEQEAIDWLNDNACEEGVYFGMVDGDLMLLVAEEEEDSKQRRAAKLAELSSRVGDDGTGDLGVIIDTSPVDATVEELVQIVLDAREEHAANVAHDSKLPRR